MIDADTIDWRSLSPRAADTLRRIALPISEGYAHAEVAEELGLTPERVARRMRELREELTGQVRPCEGCGELIANLRGRYCGADCREAARAASLSKSAA